MQPFIYPAIVIMIVLAMISIRYIIQNRKPKILKSPTRGIVVDVREVPPGTTSLTLINPEGWLDEIITHYPKIEDPGRAGDTSIHGTNRHWSDIIEVHSLNNLAIVQYSQVDNYTEFHRIHEVYAERRQEVIDLWTINGNIATLQRLHYHYDDVQGDLIPGLHTDSIWNGRHEKITGVRMVFDMVSFLLGEQTVQLEFPKQKMV